MLNYVDLSCNYFGNEEALRPLVRHFRLATIVLFGNPVLGPTGEDRLHVYIEELEAEAQRFKQAHGLRGVEFVTEAPRRRVKKGQPLGRQTTYKDFAITKVCVCAR